MKACFSKLKAFFHPYLTQDLEWTCSSLISDKSIMIYHFQEKFQNISWLNSEQCKTMIRCARCSWFAPVKFEELVTFKAKSKLTSCHWVQIVQVEQPFHLRYSYLSLSPRLGLYLLHLINQSNIYISIQCHLGIASQFSKKGKNLE
jgi:hypothetical protein